MGLLRISARQVGHGSGIFFEFNRVVGQICIAAFTGIATFERYAPPATIAIVVLQYTMGLYILWSGHAADRLDSTFSGLECLVSGTNVLLLYVAGVVRAAADAADTSGNATLANVSNATADGLTLAAGAARRLAKAGGVSSGSGGSSGTSGAKKDKEAGVGEIDGEGEGALSNATLLNATASAVDAAGAADAPTDDVSYQSYAALCTIVAVVLPLTITLYDSLLLPALEMIEDLVIRAREKGISAWKLAIKELWQVLIVPVLSLFSTVSGDDITALSDALAEDAVDGAQQVVKGDPQQRAQDVPAPSAASLPMRDASPMAHVPPEMSQRRFIKVAERQSVAQVAASSGVPVKELVRCNCTRFPSMSAGSIVLAGTELVYGDDVTSPARKVVWPL